MHSFKLKNVLRVVLVSASLLGSASLVPTIVLAANSDDDIICFDFIGANGQDELECDTRGSFKAECALSDPKNTTDHCQTVNAEFTRPTNDLTLVDTPASNIIASDVDVKTTRQ